MSLILRKRNHYPERFDHELDRFWNHWLSPFEPFGRDAPTAPSLDLAETDADVIVKVELPGLSEKDIEISVADDTLTIKGEKRQEKEEKGKRYHFAERRYGAFQRCVRLPSPVAVGRASARFKDGVLEVTLPKAEEAKPRKIEIN